nr:MAG: hypothetical protein DIU68_03120 [Chloroflexota bacterium]
MFVRSSLPWWLPGAALVLFGLLIVIFPELLALMVATAFIMIGLTWLSFGYAAHKARRERRTRVYTYDYWQQYF